MNILSVFISNRFVSFYWRIGAMLATMFLAFLAENLNMFSLSPQMIVFVGLILGEISKAINNWTQAKPMGFAK